MVITVVLFKAYFVKLIPAFNQIFSSSNRVLIAFLVVQKTEGFTLAEDPPVPPSPLEEAV